MHKIEGISLSQLKVDLIIGNECSAFPKYCWANLNFDLSYSCASTQLQPERQSDHSSTGQEVMRNFSSVHAFSHQHGIQKEEEAVSLTAQVCYKFGDSDEMKYKLTTGGSIKMFANNKVVEKVV